MNNADAYIQDETAKRVTATLSGLTEMAEPGRLEDGYFWIAFLLGNTGYAINAKYVTRVIVLREIVPFADAPAYCPGVIWDREGMICLLDLRALFGQGDYLSAMKDEKSNFPMIIVIRIGGKRRGIIVDKVISMEYFKDFTEILPEAFVQTRYIRGIVKFNLLESPTFVISPESFRSIEFEDSDMKIDWSGRYDVQLKANDATGLL